jgi:hypothetical protein
MCVTFTLLLQRHVMSKEIHQFVFVTLSEFVFRGSKCGMGHLKSVCVDN